MKPLSKRQTQVLQYAAEGLTRRETAISLGISPDTVRQHRYVVMLKLNAKSMTQAVAIAIREGLIK